ncbi:unnamed protein product [Schistocephalus solidus]|uniref:HTH psq-type domain-containing protein n=1 Tax=Schistocephalus solidus TaxID=70667 RepID=A0A183TEC0_SCHSO|nr:unnamed protein product [Schistocephalus solidus]
MCVKRFLGSLFFALKTMRDKFSYLVQQSNLCSLFLPPELFNYWPDSPSEGFGMATDQMASKVIPPLSDQPLPSSSASSTGSLSPGKQSVTATTRRPYSELELSSAVQAICSGQLGTRRAASVYGIPRSTLRNKICKLNELRRREEELLGGGRQLSLIEFVRLCAMGRPLTTVRQTSLGLTAAGLGSGRRYANVASRVSSIFRVR